jgi:DNA-binding FadR family transcriptional regulator
MNANTLQRLEQNIDYHERVAEAADDPALAELHRAVAKQLRDVHEPAAKAAARNRAMRDAHGRRRSVTPR